MTAAEEIERSIGKGARLAGDLKVCNLHTLLDAWRYGDAGPRDGRSTRRITVDVSDWGRTHLLVTVTTPSRQGDRQHKIGPSGSEIARLDSPRADAELAKIVRDLRNTGSLAKVPLMVIIHPGALPDAPGADGHTETKRLRATLGRLARGTDSAVLLVSHYENYRPNGRREPAILPAFGAPDPAEFVAPDDETGWDGLEFEPPTAGQKGRRGE